MKLQRLAVIPDQPPFDNCKCTRAMLERRFDLTCRSSSGVQVGSSVSAWARSPGMRCSQSPETYWYAFGTASGCSFKPSIVLLHQCDTVFSRWLRSSNVQRRGRAYLGGGVAAGGGDGAEQATGDDREGRVGSRGGIVAEYTCRPTQRMVTSHERLGMFMSTLTFTSKLPFWFGELDIAARVSGARPGLEDVRALAGDRRDQGRVEMAESCMAERGRDTFD
jgi:hypothetical protein